MSRRRAPSYCVMNGLLNTSVLRAALIFFASIQVAKASLVVDRELTQVSYQDLFDVFGDLDIANGNGLAEIILKRKHRIFPLLTIIEYSFGSASTMKDIGVCKSADSCKANENMELEEQQSSTPLGFLEVTDLPAEMVQLRERLLPQASDLAHLSVDELAALERPESGYSIGWSHGRETFRVEEDNSSNNNTVSSPPVKRYDTAKGSFYFDPFEDNRDHNVYPPSLQPHLEADLLKMTGFMGQVGLWIALLCDLYLLDAQQHQLEPGQEDKLLIIYNSLRSGRSGSKARLLYYFPQEDEQQTATYDDIIFDDWCGWHKDHGSLTALLPGMIFDKPGGNEVDATQNAIKSINKPGLYIQTTSSEVVHADLSHTSLGFQLGETLEILSRGRFRATPHAVKGSRNHSGRASLALFLQPIAAQILPPLADDTVCDSLQQRWRGTFGEFAQATIQAFA